MDATTLAIQAVKAQALWDAADLLYQLIEASPRITAAECGQALREHAASLHPEFRRLLADKDGNCAACGHVHEADEPHLMEAPR